MPDVNQSPQPSLFAQIDDKARTYSAVNAIRDYIYQKEPHKFLATDFLEDIPGMQGPARAVSDILPSAAIISRDPERRRQQIAEAIENVQQAKHHSAGDLAKEVGQSALEFGAMSVPASAAFTGIGHAFKGHSFKSRQGRLMLLEALKENIPRTAINAALFGGANPLLSAGSHPHRKNLDEAAKILQEHPQLASLPGAQVVLALNNNTDKPNHLGNAAVGAGVGLGASLMGAGLHGTTEAIMYRDLKEIPHAFSKDHLLGKHVFKGKIGPALTFPLAFGGISGLTSYLTSGQQTSDIQ